MDLPDVATGAFAAHPSDPKSDVMNDPAYDMKGQEEVDTCRICRGEGSQDETLFYPCKCSGSIKFVHQNCLMEWLSHSQKKHCELCKTPFRFTKLYDAHMPHTVPIPIFFRQAAIHVWKSLLVWSRLVLVVFVWLVWLPWCMRTVWRGLFWLGDGGWVDWEKRGRQQNVLDLNITNNPTDNSTTPTGWGKTLSNEDVAKTLGSQTSNKILGVTWYMARIFDDGPLTFRLAKRLYLGVFGPKLREETALLSFNNSTKVSVPNPRPSSWLSDLPYFSSLTRWTTINNMIIDSMEGAIITLCVVTAFILVFLIREWVVQQQLNLLLGPENVDDDDDGRVLGRGAPQPQNDDQDHNEADAPEPREDEGAPGVAENGNHVRPQVARLLARPRQRPQRRAAQANDAAPQQGEGLANVTGAVEPEHRPSEVPAQTSEVSSEVLKDLAQDAMDSRRRLALRERDIISRAVQIRRTLEEQGRLNAKYDIAAGSLFEDLWSRAGGELAEVVRIIEQENRTEELNWIVQTMKDYEHNAPSQPIVSSPALSSCLPEPPQSSVHSMQPPEEQNAHGEPRAVSKPTGLNISDAEFESIDKMIQAKEDDAMAGRPRRLFPEGWADPVGSSTQQSLRVPGRDGHTSDDASVDNESPEQQGGKQPLALTTTGSSPDWQWLDDPASKHDTSPEAENTEITGLEPYDNAKEQVASLEADEPVPDDLDSAAIHESEGHVDLGDPVADQAEHATHSTFEETNILGQEDPGVVPPDKPPEIQGYVNRLANWLWDDVAPPNENADQQAGDDEHVVNDIADEAPFVPVARAQQPVDDVGAPAQDPEVVAAAVQAGIGPNEADAVDDVEDVEGVMELIGMQGPLAGLIQNGMFCAILVSLTMWFGVWVPYIVGKIFIGVLADPVGVLVKAPLRLGSSSADMIVDICVLGAGCAFFWVDTVISYACAPVGWVIPSIGRLMSNGKLARTAMRYAEDALGRLMKASNVTGGSFSECLDIPKFSVNAYEALCALKIRSTWVLQNSHEYCGDYVDSIWQASGPAESLKIMAQSAKALTAFVTEKSLFFISSIPSLLRINPLRINLARPQRTLPYDFRLAIWHAKDRTIAVVAGYIFFALLAVLYLKATAWIRGTSKRKRIRGNLADFLYQAGGVLKVILIISIEMLVFPLYCGLLLDVAFLPLFENVTLMSRIHFTLASPNTSMFVHWFVGTCYMFHFALFVSMCRKILRTGVLYFIRDPDDPTFHPVRDVLERSISTQLWKISFSALVYGSLVLVCLGGVVWGISCTIQGIFPIHWSSSEPVLEFPVDLLFYNFLMPLAVKFFRPSAGLNKIYSWWFRKCARFLRLSDFLFDEKRPEELGRHVRHTWKDAFLGKQGDVMQPVIGDEQRILAQDRQVEAFFLRDGEYVRAPASDQIRIPKGALTFLPVTENNVRKDGVLDKDDGLHGRKNEMFKVIYIPPFFRARLAAFSFLVWVFAASTGVSITVVPLLFGRFIFATLTPARLRMNDVYALSIGIYILGGVAYTLFNHRRITKYIRDASTPHTTTATAFLRKAGTLALRISGLIYTYTAFAVLLPGLLSFLIECYLIIPLHTYFSAGDNKLPTPRPIIHLIQDWTLGVLYLKLFARLLLLHGNGGSRPAHALRALVGNGHGYLNPDIRLATRAFIFPSVVVMSILLTIPLATGWVAVETFFAEWVGDDPYKRACVYRFAYPAVLGVFLLGALAWGVWRYFGRWRRRVRDEVYLIGERLHNFGEGRRINIGMGMGMGKGKGKGRSV